jgi:chaperone protein EcpD
MLAPQSSQTVALSSAVNRGETLTVNNINDYGKCRSESGR